MSAIASTHFSYSTTSKSTSGVFIFIFFSSGYFHTDKQEPNILNIFFDVFGRKGSIRVERHKHTCITITAIIQKTPSCLLAVLYACMLVPFDSDRAFAPKIVKDICFHMSGSSLSVWKYLEASAL